MAIHRHRLEQTPLHVNRVRAAGRVGELFSWRRLRELPRVFRVAFLFIVVAIGVLLVVFVLMPLWFLVMAALSG